MFVPSNVNVSVAEILWKFSVWWCFVFCQLHSVVSITSCPLHRNCPVDTVKCYFCFSRSFYEMYVSIVNMYQSLLVSLFFRHFYLLISASIQLDVYRVTELGQHSCVDKLHYSRDDLQSLNISISPISNSLCATINSLGIHASSKLCIRRKSRKRNRKRISKKGKIHPIQVVNRSKIDKS